MKHQCDAILNIHPTHYRVLGSANHSQNMICVKWVCASSTFVRFIAWLLHVRDSSLLIFDKDETSGKHYSVVWHCAFNVCACLKAEN